MSWWPQSKNARYLGPMLRFFKYFRWKILLKIGVFYYKIGVFAKKWPFLLKTKLNYAKMDHNIAFWEKRHFFAENWQKSQKIVIITSTPILY
jgi:hypothetical protein